jgi:hypothetical protein
LSGGHDRKLKLDHRQAPELCQSGSDVNHMHKKRIHPVKAAIEGSRRQD